MGKQKADSTPLYLQAMLSAQKMASDQVEQAKQDKMAEEQFSFAKQAYADAQAQAAPINAQQLRNMQQQYDIAKQAQDRYTGTFIPLEDQYIAKAQGWDTPEAEAQAAGAAEANVAQQMEQARQAATRGLQAYGVNPGDPRYASLDIGTRTAGAAAAAGAGNQAINQRQMEGLQLIQNAAGLGRNLQPTALSAYAGSNASGTGVIGNTNAINTTGFSTMGTPTQYAGLGAQYSGLANQSLGQIGGALGSIYQGDVAQADAQTQGLYSALGMIGGSILSPFGPMKMPKFDEGGSVPQDASPTQGIAVDDVPARLTPGEFVVPKDVVQWKGEEHFQKLINQSREKKQEAGAKPDIGPALPVGPGEGRGRGDLPAPNRADPRVRQAIKNWQLQQIYRHGVPEGVPLDDPRAARIANPDIVYPMRRVNPSPDATYTLPELTPGDVRGQWRGPYTDI